MRQIALVITLWLAVVPVLHSEALQKSDKPLTNRDVVAMVKNALPENVIVGAIQNNATNFDISANGLIALKKAGVSQKIMEAMIAAGGSSKVAGAPNTGASATSTSANVNAATAVAPAWHPIVAYLKGKSKIELTPEVTQIASTKAKPTSLAALAADATLTQALQVGTQVAQNALLRTGSVAGSTAFSSGANVVSDIFGRRKQQSQQQRKITYVWALSGGTSSSVVPANITAFNVSYAGLPGVKADQFQPVIVKLTPTPQSSFRLVGATEGVTNAGQDPQQDWPIYSSFVEDHVAAKVTRVASGQARITPTVSLPAGQYAVALRPVDRGHKFSGEQVGKNQGEGLLFNYVWSFSIN